MHTLTSLFRRLVHTRNACVYASAPMHRSYRRRHSVSYAYESRMVIGIVHYCEFIIDRGYSLVEGSSLSSV